MQRLFLRDVFSYSVLSLLSRLTSVLIILLFTHFLSLEDFGLLTMLEVLVLVYSVFSKLGISQGIFKFYEEETRNSSLYLSSVLIVLTTSGVLLGLGYQFAPLIGKWATGMPESGGLVQLALTTAFFEAMGEVPRAFLRRERRIRLLGSLLVAQGFIGWVLAYLMVASWQMQIQGAILSGLIAEGLTTIACFALTSRHWGGRWLHRNKFMEVLNYSAPLITHQIESAGFLLIAHWMLRVEMGLAAAGIFGLSLRICVPIRILSKSVQEAWGPLKFWTQQSKEDLCASLRASLALYLFLSSSLWFLLSLWCPFVLKIVAGEAYQQAADLIPLVSSIPFAHGIYTILVTPIEMGRDTKIIGVLMSGCLIFVGWGLHFLIPRMGFQSLVIVTFAWLFISVLVTVFARRDLAWGVLWKDILLSLSITLAFLIIWDWPLEGAPSFLSYLLLTVLEPLCLYLVLRPKFDHR